MDSGVAMPTIDLLRHGDTGHRGFRGQLDDALSACGWAQMRAASQDGHWDAIVSSPLQRCAAFAHELATQRGLPLRLDPRLSEYHFGHWQELPLETLAERAGRSAGRVLGRSRWPIRRLARRPLVEFAARLAQALDDIVRERRAARVLVVTHGGASDCCAVSSSAGSSGE